MHYVQEITRHALSAETMEHTTLYKKAAHSDDPQNDWVDVYAKLSAGKSCAKPPPRFPAQPADTLVHFHLYYHDSLVQDDVRAHVSKACEMHHLQSWASKPTHGHLQANAESLNTSLLRRHATSRGWFTRKGERLLTKVVSGGLSTAARRAGRDATKQTSANCPLCGMGAGDTRHALLTCPHPELVSLREELTDDLVDTISDGLVRDSPYTEEHTLVAHPASLISPTSLYPYSTDFPALRPQDRTPLIKEFLPEGHLYLDGQHGTVTVRSPTPEVGARTVHESVFWHLVACHPLSHCSYAQPPERYLTRAADILESLRSVPEGARAVRMSWATPRELLRIIVDELRVTTELFSSVHNAYHPIRRHYTAPGPNQGANSRFAERGGFAVDGLRQEAYVGSVYANPEYDGTSIEESMEFAKVAAERPGFRAVYVIPMTDARVRQWADTTSPRGVRTRLLTVFPRHTVPFVSARWWTTGVRGRGTYKDPKDLTRVVVAVIEYGGPSTEDSLEPIDEPSYHRKVNGWFSSVAPVKWTQQFQPEGCTDFSEPADRLVRAFPAEWRFWEHRPEVPEGMAYPGGLTDSHHMVETPFLDVCNHDPMLTLVGALPPSFGLFLRGLGHPASSVAGIARRVRYASVRHLKGVWASYCSLSALTRDLAGCRPGARVGDRRADTGVAGRVEAGREPHPVLVPVVAGLPTQLRATAAPEYVRCEYVTRLESVVTTDSSTVACSVPPGLG